MLRARFVDGDVVRIFGRHDHTTIAAERFFRRLPAALPTLERRDDLCVLGKAAALLLREDELVPADDVELALRARNRGRVDPSSRQLGRETRGPLVVAPSGGAVVDLDRHGESVPSVPPADAALRYA
jgi:hypothetical protein